MFFCIKINVNSCMVIFGFDDIGGNYYFNIFVIFFLLILILLVIKYGY